MAFDCLEAVLYVNLEHRKDRRLLLLKELASLNVDENKIIRIEAVHEVLNGHLGCAKSHKKALELAIKNKWKAVAILEDDVSFIASKENIENQLSRFFKEYKDSWDVFFLGANVFEAHMLAGSYFYKVLKAQCAHAYCVHQNYYETLIRCYDKAIELMKGDLDFADARLKAIDQQWKKLQPQDRWYIGKILCQQRRSYSDIEHIVRERSHQDLFMH